ncbi:amino acid adenylation domain-containing protein, partial [Pedobacter sp. UYP1]|uniref:non-ribosomal peptide synthetase n=1 Tax=Pedobacter sp. UYP1 TaxID=1756396 RepID=UPI00339AD06B
NPVLEELGRLIDRSQGAVFTAIPQVALQADYPLSSSQRRLWILSQFTEGSIAYNMPGVFVFGGVLDEAAFSYAFESLIERHEILRTVFSETENGEVRQQVKSSEALGFRVGYQDLSETDAQSAVLESLINTNVIEVFDLSAGPLLRADVYRLSSEQWVFSYVMHHIISDGWSMGVLLKELLLLYNSYVQGQASPLTPLRIQYKDYAAWQQAQLTGAGLNVHQQYWLDQFSGELPVLELPTDKVRPAMKTYNGSTISRMIGAEVTNGINALVHEQGSTLFMGLLAALNALLYSYTQQEDIIIGSPIAGREHSDLEDQLGFYVNTLALRTQFKGTNNYKELLSLVKQVTMDAYAHQLYPFDELIEELDLQRDISRSPLFDILLILQNNEKVYSSAKDELEHLSITEYKGGKHVISKFDLTFIFVEDEQGMQVVIEFNNDVYDERIINQLYTHFEQLLTAIIEKPLCPVNQLDYLTTKEKHQLLIEFNDTVKSYPKEKSIKNLFEDQVEKTPDAIALVFENKELSYRELNEKANQLADYLNMRYVIDSDSLIGIALERNEWMVVAIAAVLKTGAGCIPIDPDYPKERIDYMIDDSNCKFLLDADELEKFRNEPISYTKENLNKTSKAEDLAYIIYTSGSTGNPKGCMLENRGIVNQLYSKITMLQIAGGTAICHNSQLYFVGSIWQLWAPLIVGGKVILCNNEELKNMGTILEKANIFNTPILEVIPSQLNEYLSHEKGIKLGAIKKLILTGEKLNTRFVNQCYADNNDTDIINGYGQSEFSNDTAYYKIPRNSERHNVLIGKPIQNTRIYILSSEGSICPIGVIGEICTSGDGICRGYINKPVLTSEKFVDNPFEKEGKMYKTGDLGKWLPDGEIEVLGRTDEQIKIRGHRIELGEIERALLQYEGIEKVLLLFKDNDHNEPVLVAYIVGKVELNAVQLRLYLSKRVPVYMLPAQYIWLDKIPLLQNGKTDKKAIAELGVIMESGIAYEAPQNETERKLVEIWEEILKKEKIGVLDNFFDLGGHSLKATTMLNKITSVFKVKISLMNIFQTPDIRKLSEEIQKAIWLQKSKNTLIEDEESREVIKI